MHPRRKRAYRWMLYHALLDIRLLAWTRLGWRERFQPSAWAHCVAQIRRHGAIADWLHNLALFSALDFEEFDEAWFWRDYEGLLKRHPGVGLEFYREEFDRQVAGEEAKRLFPPRTAE